MPNHINGQGGSNIQDSSESGGQDLTGETLVFAPDWSANLNAQYMMPLTADVAMIAAVDVNYTDQFYSALDLDPNTRHDDVTRVKLSKPSIESKSLRK